MPNFQFKLRSKTPGNVLISIRLVFYLDKKQFTHYPGIKIFPDLWNYKTQRPTNDKGLITQYKKEYPDIVEDLKIVESQISRVFNEAQSYFSNKALAKQKPDLGELKKRLDDIKTVEDTRNTNSTNDKIWIDEIIKDIIEKIEKGKIITEDGKKYTYETIKTYKNLQSQFGYFQDAMKTRYEVTDINKGHKDDFVNYFNQKKYSQNTTKKHLKVLKAIILRWVRETKDINYSLHKKNESPLISDLEVHRIEDKIKLYNVSEKDTTYVTLDPSEIELLEKVNLGKTPHLEKYRDLFLIGYYSGQRFSDYSKFSKENFVEQGSKLRLKIVQRKGEKPHLMPVHDQMVRLMEKYNWRSPKISQQKFNEYIKEVCRLAEINTIVENVRSVGGNLVYNKTPKHELVSSHTPRRSLATNMVIYQGIPYKDVMLITGHRDIRSFERYLKITNIGAIERLENSPFFNSSNTPPGHLKVV